MDTKLYDVLILGSGPAGLTAGIYTVRAGLSTLLISGSSPGGQLTQTTMVENFPGFPNGVMGPSLMDNMRSQAVKLGVTEMTGIVDKVDFSSKPFKVQMGEDLYQGRSVIIATGTETKWLGITSEKKFIGHGVSTCATCDGFFYKAKKVVVVGGGDTALEEALFLTKFASEVTVIHRRDSLRACELLQKKARANPKIKFVWNSVVVEILGKEKVRGIKIRDVEGVGSPSSANQGEVRSPSLKASADQREIETDGVFVAIGHTPNTEVFKGQVEMEEKGYIKIVQSAKFKVQSQDEKNIYNMMTSVEGVFTAGDVHDGVYKQAVTAAGFGCMAGLEAGKWLEENK